MFVSAATPHVPRVLVVMVPTNVPAVTVLPFLEEHHLTLADVLLPSPITSFRAQMESAASVTGIVPHVLMDSSTAASLVSLLSSKSLQETAGVSVQLDSMQINLKIVAKLATIPVKTVQAKTQINAQPVNLTAFLMSTSAPVSVSRTT